MKITSIRIRLLNTGNKMVGVTSLTLENMIAIHDIKILESTEGLFLAMPSKNIKNREFKDIVHPINATVRNAIEKIVFDVYDFCLREKYISAQFDVIKDFCGTIIEQSFKDFDVVYNKDDNYFISDTTTQDNYEGSNDIYKKTSTNAFLDWLNN